MTQTRSRTCRAGTPLTQTQSRWPPRPGVGASGARAPPPPATVPPARNQKSFQETGMTCSVLLINKVDLLCSSPTLQKKVSGENIGNFFRKKLSQMIQNCLIWRENVKKIRRERQFSRRFFPNPRYSSLKQLQCQILEFYYYFKV